MRCRGCRRTRFPSVRPVVPHAPGHGCGHNLLGSGSALAAVAVKEYMAANHVPGTLRYYGTPAEEGGSGKVFMLRAGLFKDVDVVLHWHPGDQNSVNNGGMLAVLSARFTFHGVAAHAAMAPERGRSALDAVMLMGNGIEFMREHVPSNSRIHYIITKGGVAREHRARSRPDGADGAQSVEHGAGRYLGPHPQDLSGGGAHDWHDSGSH